MTSPLVSPSTRGFPANAPVPQEQRVLLQFLELALRTQTAGIARHQLPQGTLQGGPTGQDVCVWIKKAGPGNSRWGYAALGLLARLLRMDVLTPVPNLGGRKAIANEAERLVTLRNAGLRVPHILALRPDGLMLSDLATPGQRTKTLAEEMESACLQGPEQTLASWRDGLAAIGAAHRRGAWLSQAFARNLVRCNDGVIGYIDFEDDPASAMGIAQCQARDWLCYLHSTALTLRTAGAFDAARDSWIAALRDEAPEVRALLAQSGHRMGWMRHLPSSPSVGRDVLRLQAAAAFINSLDKPA